MTHVTCRLTAKNGDQLQNRVLDNRVWATFTFLSVYSTHLDFGVGGFPSHPFLSPLSSLPSPYKEVPIAAMGFRGAHPQRVQATKRIVAHIRHIFALF